MSLAATKTYHLFWSPLTRHYQHTICTALILVKEGEYPELRIKAYAGRVLLAFLQHKIAWLVDQQQQQHGRVPESMILAHGAVTSMCQWFKLIESAGRYLTTNEGEEIWCESIQFLVYINTQEKIYYITTFKSQKNVCFIYIHIYIYIYFLYAYHSNSVIVLFKDFY